VNVPSAELVVVLLLMATRGVVVTVAVVVAGLVGDGELARSRYHDLLRFRFLFDVVMGCGVVLCREYPVVLGDAQGKSQ
jgi:hypothetical protein